MQLAKLFTKMGSNSDVDSFCRRLMKVPGVDSRLEHIISLGFSYYYGRTGSKRRFNASSRGALPDILSPYQDRSRGQSPSEKCTTSNLGRALLLSAFEAKEHCREKVLSTILDDIADKPIGNDFSTGLLPYSENIGVADFSTTQNMAVTLLRALTRGG